MSKISKSFEELNSSTEKLAENLDKIDVKNKKASISAKDMANSYKKEFQEVMVYIIIEKGSNFYLKSIPLRKVFQRT